MAWRLRETDTGCPGRSPRACTTWRWERGFSGRTSTSCGRVHRGPSSTPRRRTAAARSRRPRSPCSGRTRLRLRSCSHTTTPITPARPANWRRSGIAPSGCIPTSYRWSLEASRSSIRMPTRSTAGSSCPGCASWGRSGPSRWSRGRASRTWSGPSIRVAELPGLPDWEAVPTPGHTPGHVAFFRRSDRVLITGDALVTVDPQLGVGTSHKQAGGLRPALVRHLELAGGEGNRSPLWPSWGPSWSPAGTGSL